MALFVDVILAEGTAWTPLNMEEKFFLKPQVMELLMANNNDTKLFVNLGLSMYGCIERLVQDLLE